MNVKATIEFTGTVQELMEHLAGTYRYPEEITVTATVTLLSQHSQNNNVRHMVDTYKVSETTAMRGIDIMEKAYVTGEDPPFRNVSFTGGGPFKIAAIKALRRETGLGLKEAKDYVEWFYNIPRAGAL